MVREYRTYVDFKDEQEYVRVSIEKAHKKGIKGIIYLPKLKAYTASALCRTPTKIRGKGVDNIGGTYIEYGDLSYIIGELALWIKGNGISLLYPFGLDGKLNHVHRFEKINEYCKESKEVLDIVGFEEYYSRQEIDNIIRYNNSDKKIGIAKPYFRYIINGRMVGVRGFEKLLNAVVTNYNTISILNPNYTLS